MRPTGAQNHHPLKHVFATEFIASAGTYANLVKQAKSKQKVWPFFICDRRQTDD